MTKLSIYQPGKSKDFRFLDKIIASHFDVSGTRIYVHKYLGPKEGSIADKSKIINELTIQDVLFLENRDRQYDKNVIDLKGNYTISDVNFALTQFALAINDNTLFINFHTNTMIDRLGRKLMSGDVIELEHRREDVVLDEEVAGINSFYVVEDGSRAAEGYSATWQSHIWRVRAKQLTDSQEYKDILEQVQSDGRTLEEIISNYDKAIDINNANLAEAELEVPIRNLSSGHLYINTSTNTRFPGNTLISWQFNGEGVPPNQNITADADSRFPQNPSEGDYFLRTDYDPPRLFRRHDSKWCAVDVSWRDRNWVAAHRVLEDFLEDQKITKLSDDTRDQFTERQALSKVITQKGLVPNNPVPTKTEDEL